MKTLLQPINNSKRIEVVDALRGFALLGVLYANIPFGGNPPIVSAYDETLHFLYNFLISKKFISIFSMLFGFGFFIQFSRAQEKGIHFNSYFLKRMGLLFLIGCIHSFVLWNGDIIMSYAFGGVFLLLLRNWPVKKLMILAVIFNVLLTGATFIGNSALGWAVYDYDFAIINDLGLTNSYWEYVKLNWITSPWVNFLNDMPLTLFFTFGNMLIGMALGKIGFFTSDNGFKRLKTGFVVSGVLLGLPASYYFHLIMTGQLALDIPMLWVPFAIIAGMLLQSLAYITLFAALYRVVIFQKILSGFKYVGKTALTNYLSQSVFYLIVIYHCTNLFQLYGKLSEPENYLLATLFFILQSIASYFWLNTWRQGPIEYLWKKMSYSTIKQEPKIANTSNQPARSFRRVIQIFIALITLSFVSSCASTKQGLIEKNEDLEIHMVKSGKDLIETGIELPPHGKKIQGMVVFVRGSGSGDMRDYFPGFFDAYLRNVFLDKGYALVVWNKRGIGNSTGNWKRYSSFTLMAEDAINIIDHYIGVDPKLGRNVGIVGHSQGGWVVQRVAGMESNVDFAISLVGPVTTLAEQDLYRERNFLECEGLEGKKLERGIKKRMRTHNMWRKLGGWFPYFELGFMHNIVDDSTSEDLKKTKIPLLLAYGGSDGLVSLEDNQKRLIEVFPSGLPGNIQLLLDPVADHYLTVYDRLCNDHDTIAERGFSSGMHDGYIEWLEKYAFN
ncbi:alpha/beta fold hydrolase [Algoriphagus sp. SE2]|uniref:alpha/beta fold hydrolase n=1 Tax=Algoriphagus sp. SE2 TaxID=3141536 RepID=UPI0031CD5742